MERNKVFGNRYRIEERAGIGGMAEVYKATDEVLGRTVAIKVMLPQYAADPTFAARFRQEAQAAANLQSPYIVGIYDWGQDGDTYYIAMEYVRGVDLKSAILDRGALNPRKVAEIGSQVCAALSVAHSHDVIHRDIKPQNIMIQPDGNAKVMDFGIARAGSASLTTTNSVLGTAHYVSPEQAQGKTLRPSSDLYSLGITMYEAATGKLPFEGPDAVSVAMKQVSEQPVPPRQINPAIDPDLEAIIMHALEKDPNRRFASANEMRNALRSYLAGAPLPAWGAAYGAAATNVMQGGRVAADPTNVMPRGTQATQTIAQPRQGSTQVIGTQQQRYFDEQNGRNGKGSNDRGKKPLIIGIVVALVAVLCIIGGVAFATGLLGPHEQKPAQVTVPNVVGMTQDSAQTAIEKEGLKLGTVTAKESSTVEAGKVISQDPTASTKADAETKVNIVVSTGVGKVEVPNLQGKTPSEADQALRDVGLVGSNGGEEASDSVEKGQVSSQTPTAGSHAAKGSTVTYKVSTGPSKVDIPNVVGDSESSATSTLQEAGFNVTSTTRESDTYDKGIVISYSPTGQAEKGSTITITVSSGSKKISVPYVEGDSEQTAVNAIRNAGLSLGSTVYAYSNTVPMGQVISSSPSGGASVSSGSTVTLTVSLGKEDSGGGGSSSESTTSDSNSSGGGSGNN